jgi:hypothetical protein
MAVMYCALCRRPVEARRDIGLGTIVLAVLSGGLALLAVPFYSKRCSICKSAALSRTANGSGAAGVGGPADARIQELEQRLTVTQEELEATNVELDRLRTERDFYRQLLEDPAAREQRRLKRE